MRRTPQLLFQQKEWVGRPGEGNEGKERDKGQGEE